MPCPYGFKFSNSTLYACISLVVQLKSQNLTIFFYTISCYSVSSNLRPLKAHIQHINNKVSKDTFLIIILYRFITSYGRNLNGSIYLYSFGKTSRQQPVLKWKWYYRNYDFCCYITLRQQLVN